MPRNTGRSSTEYWTATVCTFSTPNQRSELIFSVRDLDVMIKGHLRFCLAPKRTTRLPFYTNKCYRILEGAIRNTGQQQVIPFLDRIRRYSFFSFFFGKAFRRHDQGPLTLLFNSEKDLSTEINAIGYWKEQYGILDSNRLYLFYTECEVKAFSFLFFLLFFFFFSFFFCRGFFMIKGHVCCCLALKRTMTRLSFHRNKCYGTPEGAI